MVAETGAEWSRASVFRDLVRTVAIHLDANGLDPATAEDRVRQHTTERLVAEKHTQHLIPCPPKQTPRP